MSSLATAMKLWLVAITQDDVVSSVPEAQVVWCSPRTKPQPRLHFQAKKGGFYTGREGITIHHTLLDLPCHQSSSAHDSDPGPLPKKVSIITHMSSWPCPQTLTSLVASQREWRLLVHGHNMISAPLLCPRKIHTN